ncbi:MAG TPA: hypothetical protein VF472_13375 [Burkholderiaceae bacterium]
MRSTREAGIVSRWAAASRLLAMDGTAKVACPVCANAILVVVDKRSDINPEFLERRLVCPLCRVMHTLRLTLPVGAAPAKQGRRAMQRAGRRPRQ